MVQLSALVDEEEQCCSSNFIRKAEYWSQLIDELSILQFDGFRLKLTKKLVPIVDQDF
jgi:hypothetical protein